jgi:ABC-type ATPase with predicted acetyltransferase domain
MNTQVFQIQKYFSFTPTITRRMGQLMNLFGLTLRRLETMSADHTLDIQLYPGDICYITGPSGVGKSVLLREMSALVPWYNRISLDDIPLETGQSLIDSTPGSLTDVVKTFNRVGLSDVFAMLQTPALLSTGQQFRYRLAKAILSGRPVVFADEFMSSLETNTAMNICRQLRVLANRTNQIFILAGVHDTFIPDLQPDVVVIKSATHPTRVIWQNAARRK